jgi:hypothetical protein
VRKSYKGGWRRKKDRGNEVDDNITGKRREVMRWPSSPSSSSLPLSLLLLHPSSQSFSLLLSFLPLNSPPHYFSPSFLSKGGWRRKKDRGNEVDDNITGKRREVMRWRIERNEGWKGGEDDPHHPPPYDLLLTTSLFFVYLCHFVLSILFLQISSSLPVSLLPHHYPPHYLHPFPY